MTVSVKNYSAIFIDDGKKHYEYIVYIFAGEKLADVQKLSKKPSEEDLREIVTVFRSKIVNEKFLNFMKTHFRAGGVDEKILVATNSVNEEDTKIVGEFYDN